MTPAPKPGALYYVLTILGPVNGKFLVQDKSDPQNIVVTEHATIDEANAEWSRRAAIILASKPAKPEKPRSSSGT